MDPIIIIGTGLAGYTTAREFRKRDKQTPLHIVTADDGSSYSKPMLSNALDKGKTADTLAMANAEKMATDLQAEIWTHTHVSAINPSEHTITTDKGELKYAKLVLAIGANPIRIPLGGDAADQVLSVNDLNDYRAFREAIESNKRVAIMGAGLIGCEFANDLCGQSYHVDVVDLAPAPLGRLLPEAAADYLQQALSAIGVHWHFSKSIEKVESSTSGITLTLSDGSTIETDVVLSAIGLRPETTLAEVAGLKTERGIVANRQLQTSDPDIYALGDCVEVEGLNLPFVMPLMNAARTIATNLAGETTQLSYPAMPVAVKTPACPTVVCPPLPGSTGEWETEQLDNGIRALFKNSDGQLLGFALLGEAVSEKMTLSKEVPNWL
jgi:rubredoxin-NAD+ reductase